MIARLEGTMHRLQSSDDAIVDVQGVGYAVCLAPNAWESLKDGEKATIWISTYVREDRLELYGFIDNNTKTLFELLIAQAGIGPKMGLELCAVPRHLLCEAVQNDNHQLLNTVKGIGKKKAEKLIVELRSVLEKHPEIFGTGTTTASATTQYDEDVMSALTSLGYDTSTILNVLKDLPEDLATTEDRVTAALRAL